MAISGYSTVASRNLSVNAVDMLEYAMEVEVLARFGKNEKHPTNKTNTVVFRRVKVWNQKANGAPDINQNDFATNEGVTPPAHNISYENVQVTIKHWAVLFQLTSDAELMYEDDIPQDMKELTGHTMAEVGEKVRWGVIRGGTVVVYANGSTRAGLNTTFTLTKLRLATRILSNARAAMTNKILSSSPNFGTSAVEPGWFVFAHTDMESDIRALPGFTPTAEYGQRSTANDYEIGSADRFRFILSPVLEPFLAAGAAVGSTGMLSANGTNVDVYPLVVVGQDAWGSVGLRGYDSVSPTYLPAKDKNHANPSGMFGFVGGDFRMNALRLNENRMVRIESCATAL